MMDRMKRLIICILLWKYTYKNNDITTFDTSTKCHYYYYTSYHAINNVGKCQQLSENEKILSYNYDLRGENLFPSYLNFIT